MNKAVWRIFGLLIIVAIIVVASYRFSTRQHTEVVEHRPPMPDIPGAAFFDVTAMQSEAGKRFAKYLEQQTREMDMPTYHLEFTLNDKNFFRLLAEAEVRPGENPEILYKNYKERFEFEKKAIFTVMMHSAAGHLFDYDLKLFVILKGNGVEYKPSDWRESNRSSELHRRGILAFSVPSGVKSLTLILRDISGRTPDKSLEWELSD